MELERLTISLADLDFVVSAAIECEAPVVVRCLDGDVIIALGFLGDRLTKAVGVWLDVSEGYPSQLAARDVATLSWLVRLEHVVISAARDAEAHADVVRALLTNDEVNFANEVATLSGAYNRPAPPYEVKVWSSNGPVVRDGDRELRIGAVRSTEAGELARFA